MKKYILINSIKVCFLEPVNLDGEGKYNLNVLKEISVTESYLGLDQEVKGCQNDEALEECRARNYIDTLLQQCKCLPLSIRVSEKV